MFQLQYGYSQYAFLFFFILIFLGTTFLLKLFLAAILVKYIDNSKNLD